MSILGGIFDGESSQTSEYEAQELDDRMLENMSLYQIFRRVMPYYKPYWLFMIAALGAVIVAVGMPFR